MPLDHGALLTDLYELTMAASYFESGMNYQACFELFVRRLPGRRSYLLTAGLEQCLNYLQRLRFHARDIDYLRSLEVFKDVSGGFFDFLESLRFTGNVYALPEGTVAFANEPLLRIEAPLIEAQLVETYLLSQTTFQTAIATKASRVLNAATGRAIVDFGSRRAHGPEASILAARACYIAGCAGTSNVEAGRLFGIPVFGTVAHSQIMAYATEKEAFEAYLRSFPDNATLLIDTYDTLEGARLAASFGERISGVRIDSGDLAAYSKQVRKILDSAGLKNVKIVASSDLNEYRIEKLLRNDAAIDLFGVGTEMVTSADEPNLSGVYKLVQIDRYGRPEPTYKSSTDKSTLPWAKQVWRVTDNTGTLQYDLMTRHGVHGPESSRPLLQMVMENGQKTSEPESLDALRSRAANEIRALPGWARELETDREYEVLIDSELKTTG